MTIKRTIKKAKVAVEAPVLKKSEPSAQLIYLTAPGNEKTEKPCMHPVGAVAFKLIKIPKAGVGLKIAATICSKADLPERKEASSKAKGRLNGSGYQEQTWESVMAGHKPRTNWTAFILSELAPFEGKVKLKAIISKHLHLARSKRMNYFSDIAWEQNEVKFNKTVKAYVSNNQVEFPEFFNSPTPAKS